MRRARLGRVGTYVALGDSFTQGPGCPPEHRWADRLAGRLRERVNPRLRFSNLAVDGATSDAVLEQAGAAAAMKPDLASVICGANDVLLSVRPDIDRCLRNLAAVLDRLVSANPAVALFTATVPDGWETLEIRPRTKRRVIEGLTELNRRTRAFAGERGIPLLDVARHPQLHDRENFGSDGLHPSEQGHELAAVEFSSLVGDLLARRYRAAVASRTKSGAPDHHSPSTEHGHDGGAV